MEHARWIEWTDAEILAEIHDIKRRGFGELRIEIFEHKVRTVTPAPDLRKLAPVCKG
jgi:hypothetical protein